jgi:ABC-type Zn uptake system ZnuABC Zn-binding protein ZnuA
MKKLIYFYVPTGLFFIGIQNITNAEQKMKNPIKIETTIPYLSDLVSKASCNSKSFQIDNIISVGSNPHSFHMTPSNRLALAKADVIVSIGSSFEPWISKIKKSKNQIWINITEGMKLKKLNLNEMNDHHHYDHNHEHEHIHEHDDSNKDKRKLHLDDHDHNHLEYDPHIWQSPSLTKEALQKIALTLKKIRPEEEKNIESCTNDYIEKINNTVLELKTSIKTIPIDKRVIATNHDALSYFASEFGFHVYSIVGFSDEAAPTAAQLKKVILEVKNKNIPAVFLESTGNMSNIKTVSKETGVKIGGTLYGDSLGPKGSGAETAPEMWRLNVNTIINALKK